MPIVFLLPSASLEEARRTIERVRAAAARHRRAEAIRFSFPIRPEIKSADVAVTAKPSVGAAPDIEAFAAWLDAQNVRRSIEAQPAPAENQATVISGRSENMARHPRLLRYRRDRLRRPRLALGGGDLGVRQPVVPLVRRALAHAEQVSEQLPLQMPSAAWRRYPV